MFSLHSLFNILCKKVFLTSLRQYLKGIKEKKSKSPQTVRFSQAGWMSYLFHCLTLQPKGSKCCPFLSSASTCRLMLVKNHGAKGKTIREKRQWYHFMASQLSL